MAKSVDDIISDIIRREGDEYTNDPDDSGGPTKYGITLATLQEFYPLATAKEVENLTEDKARQIYRTKYVRWPRFYEIANDDLRALVVDAGVLHGPGEATIMVQRAAGATVDGKWGPQTETAVNNPAKQTAIYSNMLNERRKFCQALVRKRPKDKKFLAGWLNRINEFA